MRIHVVKIFCFLVFAPILSFADDETIAVENTNISLAAEVSPESKAKNFFIGFGTDFSSFSGNLGKLYTNSNPGLDLNFGYFFNERYAVKLGFKHSIFGFNAMPVGAVDVSFLKFDSSIQYFLFPSALVNRTRSFDLYLNAGVSWVERKQTHISYNEVLKDNALGMQGGLGVSYFLIPQSLSLNAEGLVGEVFFKDRDSEVFLPAGIPNTSGGFRSASLGLKYYF